MWSPRKLFGRRGGGDVGAAAAPAPQVDPVTVPASAKVPRNDPEDDKWGICCSGGGVRSASYCLGALQVLREERVLARTTYVSAVSGGSYIASAFAIAAVRLEKGDPVPAFAPGSIEEEHLRNNSSYMAPDAAAKARLVFRIVAGALWHLFLVALVVAIVFWPLAAFGYAEGWGQLSGDHDGLVLDNVGWYLGVVGVLLLGCLLCNFELWEDDGNRPWAERLSSRLLMLAGLVLLLLVVIPQGVLAARAVDEIPLPGLGDLLPGDDEEARDAADLLGLVGGISGLTAIGGALSTFVSQRRRVLLPIAAFAAGPLIVLVPILAVVNAGAAEGFDWRVWLGLVAVLTLIWWLFDMTQWSLHPFYRRRLQSAFFKRCDRNPRPGASGRSEDTGPPGTGAGDDMTWVELETKQPRPTTVTTTEGAPPFPRLLVCAAANVTEAGATPPGRAAVPFVFSGSRVGIPGGDPTDPDTQKLDEYPGGTELTVGESVAMSGAAVSPMMGKKTIHAVRLLMALMNVRLGVWMPNPSKAAREKRAAKVAEVQRRAADAGRATTDEEIAEATKPGKPRAHLVVKEALGIATLRDPYVYVTDGGHFDNLGLVELLRRGCKTVFCLDGGGDPPGSFRALGEAIALARSELQVDVEIDPTPLTPDKTTGLAATDHVQGTLRFRSSPDGRPLKDDATGRIIYCRAAVTAESPWDVRDFARRDKRFPFHSTMDQLFTDEKFESYRALGGHAARQAVAAWRSDALRRKITTVLQERARQSTCIAYAELVEQVKREMSEAELPTLRPLLDAINAEEEAAKRPPLVLVVQNAPPPADLQTRLDEVYSYWSLDAPAELTAQN